MASSMEADYQPMVTQSRFFVSEFNTAIIDGPLRIYFSDKQESEALQLYFDIQEGLASKDMKLGALPLDIPNMFLMLYPTEQIFDEIFEDKNDMVAEGQFGEHMILGVQSPCGYDLRRKITDHISKAFEDVADHI